ncbi:MAG: 3-keto-5-aminohexanoate cleavage protein [Chloroflexaceae bacterium]|nr:3-keto-5-aminohexanoate cleavage protein [Chloroflexaceae bacterium]
MNQIPGKVMITCALTGGIHGKEANPNLPEQPDEIAEQGIAAWRAGASILHVHARKPDGSNTMAKTIYRELHERLCAETDAVVQLTTGGESAPVGGRAAQYRHAQSRDVLAQYGADELLYSG